MTLAVSRVWKATGMAPGIAAYLTHFDLRVAPALAEIAGYRGFRIFRRTLGERAEIVVITEWDSMEAVRAFAGDDPGRAVIHPAAKALLLDADEHVVHYEVARSG